MQPEANFKSKEELLDAVSPPVITEGSSVTRKASTKLPQDLSDDEDFLPLERSCLVISIVGGDCSGKKVLLKVILDNLKKKNVKAAILQQEYFYLDGKVLENQATASILNPDFTDWNKFEESLKSLAIGNPVTVRDYNFMEQKPGETLTIRPEGMIIVTGMHIMSRHIVRKLSSVSVFLEADSDVRLSRRIYQDTVIRKIPLDKAINNYLNNIKPNFETYIEPTKKFCDMVLPNFGGGYSDKHGEDIVTGGFETEYSKSARLLVESILSTLRENEWKKKREVPTEYTQQVLRSNSAKTE